MTAKDMEVADALGIKAYILDDMVVSAIRHSIAREVFKELFGRERADHTDKTPSTRRIRGERR